MEGVSSYGATNFNVNVHTTQNRGFTSEELAEICADKIISVSAIEFRKNMTKILAFYMKQAIQSDRTTIYNELVKSGHSELAEFIRRL